MTRWLVPLALPVLGLAILLSRPKLDVHWEHHPAHFWLVLITALLSVVLGYLAGEAAGGWATRGSSSSRSHS